VRFVPIGSVKAIGRPAPSLMVETVSPRTVFDLISSSAVSRPTSYPVRFNGSGHN